MQTLENYLSEYAESHQNPLNIKIHTICVPAIMWSLLGVLSTIKLIGELNLGILLAVISLIFYSLLKNIKVFIAVVSIILLCFLSFPLVAELRLTGLFIFILAWVGQFYGHKIEGKKPSFFKDLLFLLIGPIWVLKKLKIVKL